MTEDIGTLVVPDIHEQIDKLAIIDKLAERAERVVLLGDSFDSYGDSHPEEMARWLKERLYRKNWTCLIGNHDAGYFFRHRWFACSNASARTREIVNSTFTEQDIRQFKLFTRAGGFLLSHAGFHPDTIHMATAEHAEMAMEKALSGGFDDIFSVGYYRGGYQPVGGCTWLDWNAEFDEIDGVPQIVGHTRSKKREVRRKGNSFCIDTRLNHVAYIVGNAVTIRPLSATEATQEAA